MLAFSPSLSLSVFVSLPLSAIRSSFLAGNVRVRVFDNRLYSPLPGFQMSPVVWLVWLVSWVLESGQAFVSVVQIVFISAYFNNINWLEYNDTRQQRPLVTHRGPVPPPHPLQNEFLNESKLALP